MEQKPNQSQGGVEWIRGMSVAHVWPRHSESLLPKDWVPWKDRGDGDMIKARLDVALTNQV